MTPDSFANHGILAHEDDGMSSKRATNLLKLLGSDIVGTHDEAFRVFIKKLLLTRVKILVHEIQNASIKSTILTINLTK